MNLNILGTWYTVGLKDYRADDSFRERGITGYCDGYKKEIVLCNSASRPGWEKESAETIYEYEKIALQHEIVHAFLFESGLAQNSASCEAWASNEEMVDWISRQGIKIFNVWKAAEYILFEQHKIKEDET